MNPIQIFFIFLLLLTGCSEQKKILSPKRITMNLQEGDPPSLNPYVGVDLRSRCLFLALYEPLMRKNAKGEMELAAAEKVEIDPTQTIYTFHLRPSRWSNGEPVTSHHFAKAWKYALTPGTCCFRADLFYPIKNAEKVKKGQLPIEELKIFTPDEKTLVVELEHPVPYFLDLTATSFFCPLLNPDNKDPESFNGPYIVGERIRDQRMVFYKNPYYWDSSAVELEEICFTMVKDPMTALTMYERGELDLVGDPFSPLPFDVIPSLEESGKLQSKLVSRIFYLLLNANTPVLQQKQVRQALGLCIDRGQLTDHLFFRELPTYSPLPKPLALADEQEFTNPKDAIQLFEEGLAQLNLTRETFPKIILSYAELSGQKSLAEFLQDQWKQKLGIEVEIVGSQWNSHIANLRSRNYQIGTLHLTTLYPDPMFYFDLFRSKQDLCNYTGWEDPDFRHLLEESERQIEPNARRTHLKQVEIALFDQMPVIPLFTQNLLYLVREPLSLAITDLGIYDFKNSKM